MMNIYIPLDTNSQMKTFHLTQQERLNWILEQQITHIFVSAQHEQYISYSIIILYGLLDQHVQLWDD